MAMQTPNIKTTKDGSPIIYAYTTPEIKRHDGWTKIGDTIRDFDTRIDEQTKTVDVDYNLEWIEDAFYPGTREKFRDHDFHKALTQSGIERLRNKNGELTEWFNILPEPAHIMLMRFRQRKIPINPNEVVPYILRDEQNEAVEKTLEYRKSHEQGEFLWNAKPRFGKTLAVYDLMKRCNANKVLIVTNRPAIANSWYSDYVEFIGCGSNYLFVSSTDALKGKPYVFPYDKYAEDTKARKVEKSTEKGIIYFVSLQDIKDSKYFGGERTKLKEISTTEWDLLVVDEAHEGVDTYRTDAAFNHIQRKFTLHLSGTPFKAIANEKFKTEAIFNWTYADEQKRKAEFKDKLENPYADLPKLNMYTYQMSEVVAEKIDRGIEIQGQTEEYAFDLGEFFKTKDINGTPVFIYNEQVDLFLEKLANEPKYPFSTEILRSELKHTLWLLDRVDSVKALAKKLEKHRIFKDYKIVPAAGDGRVDENDDKKLKSFDEVRKAIAENEKTITLSVGQLTTGVTIPEWTAVLMLSNISSPSLYIQAAFRVQNPWHAEILDENGRACDRRKENAYVFDFDPARTLTVFEQFANNLIPNIVTGNCTVEQRENNIRELLNFFPVIAETDNGELIELDAAKVLSIPRKIRSEEVVRRGFMSNFLFNIRNVFNIPKDALDVINKLPPVKAEKTKKTTDIVVASSDGFSVDDDGNVSASDDYVQEKSKQIFGKKIFGGPIDSVNEVIDDVNSKDKAEQFANAISSMLIDTANNVVQEAQKSYGAEMGKSDTNQIVSQLKKKAELSAHDLAVDFQIKRNKLEEEKRDAIEKAIGQIDTSNKTSAEIEKVMSEIEKNCEKDFTEKTKKLKDETTKKIQTLMDDFEEESKLDTTKKVEESKEQKRATEFMMDIRDRLRGFSRTIPSFIMAYGDSKGKDGKPVNITLATFDEIVPDEVFKEVTSISIEEFRQLRDGFDYVDSDGNTQHFEGKLFDQIVFDDSIVEFVEIKKKLANYFDPNSTEDIFSYIPPQKTNQIFTPKDVVKRMVDMLEQENPGCFDDKDKTFIDLYMKSGLYITEIVKRLYQSKKMKELFPNDKERLRHIFEHQVYGLAPTEIIYKIATSFILGFADNTDELKHNFKQFDALPYAKEGTLKQKLDELFGE